MTHPRMAQIEAIQEQNKAKREFRALAAERMAKDNTEATINGYYESIANAETSDEAERAANVYLGLDWKVFAGYMLEAKANANESRFSAYHDAMRTLERFGIPTASNDD